MSDRTAHGSHSHTKATKTPRLQGVFVIIVSVVVFVTERGQWLVSAQAQIAPPATSPTSVTPREAALTILERANRPFVPYVAVE